MHNPIPDPLLNQQYDLEQDIQLLCASVGSFIKIGITIILQLFVRLKYNIRENAQNM